MSTKNLLTVAFFFEMLLAIFFIGFAVITGNDKFFGAVPLVALAGAITLGGHSECDR